MEGGAPATPCGSEWGRLLIKTITSLGEDLGEELQQITSNGSSRCPQRRLPDVAAGDSGYYTERAMASIILNPAVQSCIGECELAIVRIV